MSGSRRLSILQHGYVSQCDCLRGVRCLHGQAHRKFSGIDEFDQEFGFQNVRAAATYENITSSLPLRLVLTHGSEGVSSRIVRFLPYRSEARFWGSLPLGRRFTVPDSGLALIPSVTVRTEIHNDERIIEGDIVARSREADALPRDGVAMEFRRLFVRPFVALMAVDNGWLMGGAVRPDILTPALNRSPGPARRGPNSNRTDGGTHRLMDR